MFSIKNFLFCSFSLSAYASPFVIQTNEDYKLVSLQEIHSSKIHSFTDLFSSAEKDYSKGIIPFINNANSVDLGMNNVPVFDQGQYGTCVTFSTTAALDTVVNELIDQQCTLELTSTLGTDYWDGADYSSQIIEPLKQYGVVKSGSCPSLYPNRQTTISLSDYAQLQQPIAVNYVYHAQLSLDTLKSALKNGHRVTIGFGLQANDSDPISVEGYDIRVNGKTNKGGLWACHQSSASNFVSFGNYCGNPQAGHEVVVIGYDDKQQLLKVRNSWNTQVGDNGDFYMTYAFFQAMDDDGTEIY